MVKYTIEKYKMAKIYNPNFSLMSFHPLQISTQFQHLIQYSTHFIQQQKLNTVFLQSLSKECQLFTIKIQQAGEFNLRHQFKTKVQDQFNKRIANFMKQIMEMVTRVSELVALIRNDLQTASGWQQQINQYTKQRASNIEASLNQFYQEQRVSPNTQKLNNLTSNHYNIFVPSFPLHLNQLLQIHPNHLNSQIKTCIQSNLQLKDKFNTLCKFIIDENTQMIKEFQQVFGGFQFGKDFRRPSQNCSIKYQNNHIKRLEDTQDFQENKENFYIQNISLKQSLVFD